MMVITPVWSALGYSSSMASSLSAESSFEQGVTAHNQATAEPQNAEHCRHQDKFKIACHASGGCSFHVCGDGGVAAVYLLTQAYSVYRYAHWEKSASRSLAFSPEIRPPINSL